MHETPAEASTPPEPDKERRLEDGLKATVTEFGYAGGPEDSLSMIEWHLKIVVLARAVTTDVD